MAKKKLNPATPSTGKKNAKKPLGNDILLFESVVWKGVRALLFFYRLCISTPEKD